MASSDMKLKYTWKELLTGAERLSTNDFEALFENLKRLRITRQPSPPPSPENDLLEKIKLPFLSQKESERYDFLYQQFREQNIDPVDYQELVSILQKREMAAAMQLENLVKLSELRNISLDSLKTELGLDKLNGYA